MWHSISLENETIETIIGKRVVHKDATLITLLFNLMGFSSSKGCCVTVAAVAASMQVSQKTFNHSKWPEY